MRFFWYEQVTSDILLTQGDILLDFPVPVMVENTRYPFYSSKAYVMDLVVMTQACDLEQEKTDIVTLCAIEGASTYLKRAAEFELKREGCDLTKLNSKQKKKPGKIIEEIRKGLRTNCHLLEENVAGSNKTTITMEHQIVALSQSYQLPLKAVKQLIKEKNSERLRLLPPYRELLAQAYANMYSRIGLPLDVNTENLKQLTL